MDNKRNKYISYVKTGLYYLVAFAIAFYIVISVVVPDNVVNIIGFKPYVVITQSMEPEIKANDLVIVKKYNIEELKQGDIITFEVDFDFDGNKEVVTHYVFSKTQGLDDKFTIRTNPYFEEGEEVTPDFWALSEESILGEYSFHIPWVGTLILFLQSPFGIAAMVVNVGVIVAVVVMIKQGKKNETKDEEKSE